jgi:hypothetical protein
MIFNTTPKQFTFDLEDMSDGLTELIEKEKVKVADEFDRIVDRHLIRLADDDFILKNFEQIISAQSMVTNPKYDKTKHSIFWRTPLNSFLYKVGLIKDEPQQIKSKEKVKHYISYHRRESIKDLIKHRNALTNDDINDSRLNITSHLKEIRRHLMYVENRIADVKSVTSTTISLSDGEVQKLSEISSFIDRHNIKE